MDGYVKLAKALSNGSDKCNREDCYANGWGGIKHRCGALGSTYDNDNECPFYAHKDSVSLKQIVADCNAYRIKMAEKGMA